MNLPAEVASEVWRVLEDFATRFPDLRWLAQCDEWSLIVAAQFDVRVSVEPAFRSSFVDKATIVSTWKRFEVVTVWNQNELCAAPRVIVLGLERRLGQLRQAVLNHQP